MCSSDRFPVTIVKYMGFSVYDFTSWLNSEYSNYSRIVFLFNGPELGFPSESEYIMWLLENGLEEEVIDSINFYDKGYNFFRTMIDAGMDSDDMVNMIKYMVDNGINDSREIEDWDSVEVSEDMRELLEGNEDIVTIPDVLEYLGGISGNIVLCGYLRMD